MLLLVHDISDIGTTWGGGANADYVFLKDICLYLQKKLVSNPGLTA
jgi:hypothetical protein